MHIVQKQEPAKARLVAFVDGQNLFGAAKELYKYMTATYDPLLLTQHVAGRLCADVAAVRFYTGVHTPRENQTQYDWWQSKLHRMRNSGVIVTQRALAYHVEEFINSQGQTLRKTVPREKGIDLRIGLDMVRLARERVFDTVVVFSQDNDLGEACQEVQEIGREQGRNIRVACAYPCGIAAASQKRRRGIEKTEWVPLTQSEYDACLAGPIMPGAATCTGQTVMGAAIAKAIATAGSRT